MRDKLHLLTLAACVALAACGGGSGSTKEPSATSSSSTSASSSSTTSSTSSTGSTSSSTSASTSSTTSTTSSTTSSSTSSSGGTSSTTSSSTTSSTTSASSTSGGALIPNATTSGTAYCRIADSDPDGDGWGWETGSTCVVYGSSVDPGVGDLAYCVIGTDTPSLCDSDNGSWSYENGAACISRSLCPGIMAREQTAMSDTPVNPNADDTAKAVYSYLQSQWGRKMLSGQMDLTWKDSTDQYQRVINDTGKAPAIMGYDYMNYGIQNSFISGFEQTEEAIEHWQRGGLVTFAWHWRDPNVSGSNIGEFYTDSTSFQIPIANGQLDESSESFTNMKADIDMIAAELQSLEDAGATVLWRPLHEASGGWFWWGRSRTDDVSAAYAQVVLWRYMYDRLTEHHGLNNLIWIWNGQNSAWYPGDEYVDIASHDIYDGQQNYESQLATYSLTKDTPMQTKMVALSENSNIPDPDAMEADGAWWLFFMVWNDSDTEEGVTHKDNFWTGNYYNTLAHKQHVYNHELVITLDELPSFTTE